MTGSKRRTANGRKTELSLLQEGASKIAKICEKESDRSLSTLAKAAQKNHLACLRSATKTVCYAALAGIALIKAKKLLDHGDWGSWLEENFTPETGLTQRTAQRYMKVAAHFEKISAIATAEIGVRSKSTGAIQDPLDHLSITEALAIIGRAKASSSQTITRLVTVRGNDWLTPKKVVQAGVDLLGEVDLDPASEAAAKNIPAKRHITADDDSLRAEVVWKGTIFLNAGCDGNLTPWVEKAIAHFEAGDVGNAILLLPAPVQPSWPLSIRRFPAAFSREPFKVQLAGTGDTALLKRPLMFVYVTSDPDVVRFAELFSPFSDVFVPFSK